LLSTRFLLLTACAGLALAACGGSDSKSTANTPAAAGSTPAVTAAATKASTSAPVATQPAATQKPATTSKVPADACALVTLDQVHQLAPTAGEGKVSPQQGGPGQTVVACRWEWPEGIGSLDVKISTLPVGGGITADDVKAGLRATVADGKENGRELSGIGDVAIFRSPIKADANVQAVVNGLMLDIDLNVLGARDSADKLIAFAKVVAGGM
jgi:hypothetical protein